ncbi:hypothetical protein IAD21_02216 [Abditibacteriota bacterium]|nr:hypothetical protein IAD21_02216 [Abditibacteriota bacterium]
MKSLFIPVLLLCSVVHADVTSVRGKVTHINAMKLASKTYNRTDLSSEGAQISIWRDAKGVPRKIAGHIYGEMGREHDTIYLENGLPVFLLTIKERYDGPLSVSVKVKERTEMRLYFEKGNVFQRRDGNKVVSMSAAQKQEGNKLVRDMIKVYLAKGE